MRQHLIDRGRHRAVRERSAPLLLASMSGLARPTTEQDIAVRQVWNRLRQHDALAGDIVWKMKVEGKTINEVATHIQMAPWRVVAKADYALEWMASKLG